MPDGTAAVAKGRPSRKSVAKIAVGEEMPKEDEEKGEAPSAGETMGEGDAAWSDGEEAEDDGEGWEDDAPEVRPPKAAAPASADSEALFEGQLAKFEPEPLHVRSMFHAERRVADRELAKEQHKLETTTELLSSCDEVREGPRFKELSETAARCRYNVNLLERRKKRLGSLDPLSHTELPQQTIEAAFDGDLRYVKLAIEAQVSIDVQDKLGKTPLIAATITNRVSVVKLLLEFKADPYIQDANLATCAHYAVQLNHVHSLDALFHVHPGEYWDVVTMKDSRGLSAIDYARPAQRQDFQQLLRTRMGGPVPVLWQVFKGWMADKTGVPRRGGRQAAQQRGCCASCCACSKVERHQPRTLTS